MSVTNLSPAENDASQLHLGKVPSRVPCLRENGHDRHSKIRSSKFLRHVKLLTENFCVDHNRPPIYLCWHSKPFILNFTPPTHTATIHRDKTTWESKVVTCDVGILSANATGHNAVAIITCARAISSAYPGTTAHLLSGDRQFRFSCLWVMNFAQKTSFALIPVDQCPV